MIWAAIDADGDLAGLQAAVEEAVERVTEKKVAKKKGKPYHPHVTLARCDPPWPPSALDRLVAGFGHDHSRPFRLAEGFLIASELRRGAGPRYRKISTYPLRGGL